MKEEILSQTLLEIVDDEPRISHRVIAEHTNNDEKSVSKIIRKHSSSFEKFGRVGFEIQSDLEVKEKQKENPNYRAEKTYYLNEPQATLLLTFMRNNEVVIDFKIRLVDEFFRMRNQLQNKNSEPTPQPQKVDLVQVLDDTRSSIELIREVFSYSPFEMVQLDQSAKKRGEVSPIELFGIDLSDVYLLPTELGKLIGKTAMETNHLLAQKGYQIRVNGVWTLTEKGRDFGIQLDNRYQQIKWRVEAIL